MKSRIGFVSNSSSTSFVCIYNKTDEINEKVVELLNWIDKVNKEATDTYKMDDVRLYSYSPKVETVIDTWVKIEITIASDTCGQKEFYDRIDALEKTNQFKRILMDHEGCGFELIEY